MTGADSHTLAAGYSLGELLSEKAGRRLYRARGECGERLLVRYQMALPELDLEERERGLKRGLALATELQSAPHPGLARVHHAAIEDQALLMVVDEVPGTNLETVLAWHRQKLPPEQVLGWVHDFFSVLVHLHEKLGWSTRCCFVFNHLKVTPDGTLKLLDPGWEHLLWDSDTDPPDEKLLLDGFRGWLATLAERLGAEAPSELIWLSSRCFCYLSECREELQKYSHPVELQQPFEIPWVEPPPRPRYRPHWWQVALALLVVVALGWVWRGEPPFALQEKAFFAATPTGLVCISAAGGQTLSQLALPSAPSDLVADGTRGLLYAALPASGRVAVIDAAELRLLHLIGVGERPAHLALSAGGDRLYCLEQERPWMTVLDVTGKPVPSRLVTVAPNSRWLAASDSLLALTSPAQNLLYRVTSESSETVYLDSAGPVALSRDGSTIYVLRRGGAGLAVVDAATLRLRRTQPCPGLRHPVALVVFEHYLIAVDDSGLLVRLTPSFGAAESHHLNGPVWGAGAAGEGLLWVGLSERKQTLLLNIDNLQGISLQATPEGATRLVLMEAPQKRGKQQ